MKSQPAAALGVFPGIFCLAACTTQPAVILYSTKAQGPKTIQTYVASHGWHTALIVPAADLNRQIPGLEPSFGAIPAYYEIGWGDAGFYQAKTVTASLALRAAFYSSATVVHISTVPISPYQSFPHSQIVSLPLSQEQFDQMSRFIASSMTHDDRGKVTPLGRGIYGDSRFYPGTGHYSVINTCNKWTAKGLRSAGVEISPWSKFSSKSVMRVLEKPPTLVADPSPATPP